ncbi:MAG: hypothetical protein GY796_14120 [Chloroflexi bacterium]|nr:hypothetical protein [Chloroflexota bacterium]
MMKKLLWLTILLGLGVMTGFISDGGSCQRPLPWQKQQCEEMEQAILKTTVRIALHGWIEIDSRDRVERIYGTISHATVIDGQYLLTHNHFGIPLSQLDVYSQHANSSFTGVSVYRLDGTAVLDHAPLDVFVIASETGETTLLDFGAVAGEGFFTHADIGSAQIADNDTNQLHPGAEVAQIDWDGQDHTQVVWTQIKTIYRDSGLPRMEVNHFIELGASGGGVFLNGKLIGNNWGRIIESSPDTDTVRHQLSLVALNSYGR